MLANQLLSSFSQAVAFRPSYFAASSGRRATVILVFAAGVVSLGGCAQQPTLRVAAHSKEYFPSSKYGPASERVVADGEPVPRGGGTYMVGRPYSVAGHTYYPSEKRYAAVGLASWYGDAFHGRRTANGEIYDRDAISAAHPTMPLPSYARVTNLGNSRSIIVRVNDRGPFAANRIMDVSRKAAEALDFQSIGTARVKVEYIAPASLEGSDDDKLLATLRLDGPATLDAVSPTMAANAQPAPTPLAFAAFQAPQPQSDAGPTVSQRATDESANVEQASDEHAAKLAFAHAMRQVAMGAPLPPMRPVDLGRPSPGKLRVAMRARAAE